jgi:hypothetical protein
MRRLHAKRLARSRAHPAFLRAPAGKDKRMNLPLFDNGKSDVAIEWRRVHGPPG